MGNGADVNIKIAAEDAASAVFEQVRANFDKSFEGIAESGSQAGDAVRSLSDGLKSIDGKGLDGIASGMDDVVASAGRATTAVSSLLEIVKSFGTVSGIGAIATALAGVTKYAFDFEKQRLDQEFQANAMNGNGWGAAWEDIHNQNERDRQAQQKRIAARDAADAKKAEEQWKSVMPTWKLKEAAKEELFNVFATDVEKWTAEFNKALTAGGRQHGSDPAGLAEFLATKQKIKATQDFIATQTDFVPDRPEAEKKDAAEKRFQIATGRGAPLVESRLLRGGSASGKAPSNAELQQAQLDAIKEANRQAAQERAELARNMKFLADAFGELTK